jgi:hypothetical protein
LLVVPGAGPLINVGRALSACSLLKTMMFFTTVVGKRRRLYVAAQRPPSSHHLNPLSFYNLILIRFTLKM